MNRTPRPKKTHRPSTLRLRWTRSLRQSWTRWRLKRTARKIQKEQRRLTQMQLALDSQLLLMKELDQVQDQLRHRLQEMAEAEAFHQRGLLTAEPETAERAELDRLLGL